MGPWDRPGWALTVVRAEAAEGAGTPSLAQDRPRPLRFWGSESPGGGQGAALQTCRFSFLRLNVQSDLFVDRLLSGDLFRRHRYVTTCLLLRVNSRCFSLGLQVGGGEAAAHQDQPRPAGEGTWRAPRLPEPHGLAGAPWWPAEASCPPLLVKAWSPGFQPGRSWLRPLGRAGEMI